MIVIGRLQYPDAATARADGWRFDNTGVARRAAPCPRGGRHKARRYPRDGTLPVCWQCGEVFTVETATWQYVKTATQRPRKTHGKATSLSAKGRSRPDAPEGDRNAPEGKRTRTNR